MAQQTVYIIESFKTLAITFLDTPEWGSPDNPFLSSVVTLCHTVYLLRIKEIYEWDPPPEITWLKFEHTSNLINWSERWDRSVVLAGRRSTRRLDCKMAWTEELSLESFGNHSCLELHQCWPRIIWGREPRHRVSSWDECMPRIGLFNFYIICSLSNFPFSVLNC